MKRIIIGIVTVALAVALAGCGTFGGGGNAPGTGAGAHDLKHVKFQDPDSAVGLNNVDQYPNIVRVCFDGVAFATTTRPDFSSIQRVPEWDKFCPAGRG